MENEKCLLCLNKSPLTDEHIISQSLGGSLSKKIYCAECNNILGRTIDSELSKIYGKYATILSIKRDRGNNQTFEVTDENTGIELIFTGKEFVRKKPIIKIIKDESGKIQGTDITARSMKELKQKFKEISAKYQVNWKFDDHLKQDPASSENVFAIDDIILGSPTLYRAIAKIAYSVACYKLPQKTIVSDDFSCIRSFIQGKSAEKRVSPNYLHCSFMTDKKRPLHKVLISYVKSNRIIVGYVSLFGTFCFTVLLAENFKSKVIWPPIDYTYNPITRCEVPINLKFKPPELRSIDVINPKQNSYHIQSELQKGLNVIVDHSNGILNRVSVVTEKA